MKMTNDTHKNHATDPLDMFFDAARADPPAVSPQLRARILADASRVQAGACRPHRASPWQRLRMWFGGWTAPSLAGGLTAAAAGFWFGVAAPMPVAALDAPVWLQDTLSYLDVISTPIVGLDDPLLLGF
ncbi:hypothetical protein [Roseinatronobacter sp. NSM]|uniref:hypothetical protein n=1 Tax=Roseinatronobacter sp. NSM TaxID=3457785 RepID=UPI004037311D